MAREYKYEIVKQPGVKKLLSNQSHDQKDDLTPLLPNRLAVVVATLAEKGGTINPWVAGDDDSAFYSRSKLKEGPDAFIRMTWGPMERSPSEEHPRAGMPILTGRTEVGFMPGSPEVVIQSFVPRGTPTKRPSTDVLLIRPDVVDKFIDAIRRARDEAATHVDNSKEPTARL